MMIIMVALDLIISKQAGAKFGISNPARAGF